LGNSLILRHFADGAATEPAFRITLSHSASIVRLASIRTAGAVKPSLVDTGASGQAQTGKWFAVSDDRSGGVTGCVIPAE